MITRTQRFVSVLLLMAMAPAAPSAAVDVVAYRDAVRKVFKTHCVDCHGPSRPSAGLDLSSYGAILDGSSAGEVVIAGDPADSFLYLVTAHEEEPIMPPGGERIPEEDLLVLRQWIEQGMPEEADSMPLPVASAEPSALPKPTPDAPEVRRSPIVALAVSESRGLLAVSDQLRVLVYDLNSQQLQGCLPFPEGEPQSLQFSENGRYLTAGGGVHGESGVVVVWSTDPFQRVWRGDDEGEIVLAASLSPDTSRVALGGPRRIVRVLATDTGETLHTLEKHTDWALDAVYDPAGLLLATCDRDGGIYVWEAQSGALLHSLRGHTDATQRLAWEPSGDVLVSASRDGSIRRWDMHTGKQISRWEAHEKGVVDLALAESSEIWSVGSEGQIKCWSSSGELISERKLEGGSPTVLVAAGDSGLALGAFDGALSLQNREAEQRRPFLYAAQAAPMASVTIDPSAVFPEPIARTMLASVENVSASPTVLPEKPSPQPLTPPRAEATPEPGTIDDLLAENHDDLERLNELRIQLTEAIAAADSRKNRAPALARMLALSQAALAIEFAENALERERLLSLKAGGAASRDRTATDGWPITAALDRVSQGLRDRMSQASMQRQTVTVD